MVTDLAPEMLSPPALPLDLISLQNLLTVYARLNQQVKERVNHGHNDSATITIVSIEEAREEETSNAKSDIQQPHPCTSSLANFRPISKRKTISADNKNLLHTHKTHGHSSKKSGDKR
jgi:hypothetical protein